MGWTSHAFYSVSTVPGEVMSSVLQMKRPKLQGPRCLLKIKGLTEGRPRRADLSAPALTHYTRPPCATRERLGCPSSGTKLLQPTLEPSSLCSLNTDSANPSLTSGSSLLRELAKPSLLRKRFPAAISSTPTPDKDPPLPVSFTWGDVSCVRPTTHISAQLFPTKEASLAPWRQP